MASIASQLPPRYRPITTPDGSLDTVWYQWFTRQAAVFADPTLVSGYLVGAGGGFIGRTIVAASSKVTITDGDGILNNTSINIDETAINLPSLAGILPVTKGGTGASVAATARSNLGIGTIGPQNSNNVTITGGTMSGVTITATGAALTNGTISGATITGGSITGMTDITLADGGTSASLTASNGGIVYSTAAAMAILSGTATANKVLMSGSSTTPSWSTPTFPNASATTLKYIRSDGTNWIASTSTLPDSYAQGDILYASASNVLSSLAKNTSSTRYLSNTGGSNNPAWAQVALTTGVTGTLPVGNGGTGVTTSTGTGNTVLSADPTFTGTVTTAIINATDVVATRFRSLSGSASALSATATTLITLPSSTVACYFVSANIGAVGDSTNYGCYAIIYTDGASVRIFTQVDGALHGITMSGLNIQSTQYSGATQTINMTATRLS